MKSPFSNPCIWNIVKQGLKLEKVSGKRNVEKGKWTAREKIYIYRITGFSSSIINNPGVQLVNKLYTNLF